MSKLVIEGLRPLCGEINVQGAKNSALPILAASVAARGESVIHNCPRLSDIDVTVKILRYLGCKVTRDGNTVTVDSTDIIRDDIPLELMREMRSSIIFLGALISAAGHARVSFPGGCDLGPRPIDIHLKALRKMGITVNEHRGFIDCTINKNIKGCKLALEFPSVGATENIILTAVKAQGRTIITNAAAEPEIIDLCDFLNSCGAKITTGDSGTVIIDGVSSLNGCSHCIIPDRIAAATYMCAGAVCGGDIVLNGVIPSHLSAVIPVFEECGCIIMQEQNKLRLIAPDRLKAPKFIRTMPYPGFPTDAQPPVMALATQCDGTTVFVENIFESRYNHISELIRLGAKIKLEGKVAVVEGNTSLYGTNIHAFDLRGAAALVTAALCAEGKTVIYDTDYLERGYEDFDVVLNSLGASVKKI
ncbi:MAG: UDP-N-acetylglucosamine 1-carboxyvinyltransferase [Clostridiales bacterium]|nr:UDP-N-acetylglucosamine 1-carboxyvinyltransferase [Clostridiales bacterium]